jgi:hypothetical protein
MNAHPKTQPITRGSSGSASTEQRLKELHIELPASPAPFGTHAKGGIPRYSTSWDSRLILQMEIERCFPGETGRMETLTG